MKKRVSIIIIILLIFLFASCSVPIATIKKNPQKFVNKKITIEGKVIKITKIPLTSLKILQVYDGTEMLYVLSDREVKKNVDMKFTGEIVAMGGKVTQERVKILIKKIAKFLVEKNLVDKKDSINYSKKVYGFLKKIMPKKTIIIFMLEE